MGTRLEFVLGKIAPVALGHVLCTPLGPMDPKLLGNALFTMDGRAE